MRGVSGRWRTPLRRLRWCRRGLRAGTTAVVLIGGCLTGCDERDRALVAGAAVMTDAAGAPPIGIPFAVRGFAGGVVTTSEPRATAAAAGVLAAGGNAIDAAATAQFMLNVVEPESSGLGGGGFLMVYLAASRTLTSLDAREMAPAAATADMFVGTDGTPLAIADVSTSGLAVGVPGTLRGVEEALARWGTISLGEALAPAIAAAEQGVSVGQRLAASLARAFDAGGRLANEPGNPAYEAARRVFGVDSRPLQQGERLRQPALATTFRAIATAGSRAFYDCGHPSGIARAIVAAQANGRASLGPAGAGRMTCADLAGYQVVERPPVEGRYRGVIIRTMPLPSAGGIALLQMLGMLEPFAIGVQAARLPFGSAERLSLMQEAMRLVAADRAVWTGDPDRVADLPVRGLLDPRYLKGRAAACSLLDKLPGGYCLQPGIRLHDVRAGDPRPFDRPGASPQAWSGRSGRDAAEGENTTHFTVVDRWGNIASVTSTIEAAWGTGLLLPAHGFLLNNELTDFNAVPRQRGRPHDPDFDPGANDVAPFKRPRSSMTPTVLFAPIGGEGERPVAALGSPGGPDIANTLLAVTLNLIDDRRCLQDAIDRPRISVADAADGAVAKREEGFDPAVVARLQAQGYRFRPAILGSVQAIVIDPRNGLAWGAADPRRDGAVIGLPARSRVARRHIRQPEAVRLPDGPASARVRAP